MEVQSLLFWFFLFLCPGCPNTNILGIVLEMFQRSLPTHFKKFVHILPGHFPLGSDGVEILWTLTVVTESLGICAFLIYLWRTIFAVEPQEYQVNLQQITEKINWFEKESRELAEEISIWEQKIREAKKHLSETKTENMFLSDETPKLKLQDEFEDPELRVLRSKKYDLEDSKKVLEDKCNALSSVKTTKEAELKQLKKKMDTLAEFYEQTKVAAEEKLKKTHYELVAKKNQLSATEKNLKVATEEIDKYKQQVQEMQEQLQESELTFRHQIAVHEKNAQDNWVKARIWEREIAQQSREKAYLKHRLGLLEESLPERHRRQELIPGRPEIQNPPGRGLFQI
ncbi:transport and Golgi organization protein 1 homolog isoform X4 [Canis lupus familiaris]|uniref:transport and Golgi organization protein 1 homolog isoform X4 n=1 Tax=Canis lupus familiaris TaxID=9615 RepID=UPI0003AE3682|nr:transport and Golgi organization protein 1 homolog isoform X4 [Canis lupus familiaris]XP_025272115.1 transport and Golgi organization protein 1 homolog isoform X5 [Canis lupus dingo]XP_038396106.1 transport and Golgi organization protein 1 homolog isoform X4 [Canis lupus familiaris]XP_038524909.1 transport and Golgi organization protein 1 homolog isoform X4 [Canis lupus familiaris]|eukprot:XP_005621528.1 melanoma inhibitory activity protein 3-like isoform X2 [Canis lupus familiaris]